MDNLERLFREYHGPIVRYLTRRLGDRDLAEELAQETFVRAMRHGPVASERAWLFAVATNLVRDEARRDARERRRLVLVHGALNAEPPAEPEVIAAEHSADELEARLREQALARRAVDTLAERDRMALLLREEGLDYHEIAAALGLSVGSVGTTLSRARRRLVEIYETLQRDRAGLRAAKEGSDVA